MVSRPWFSMSLLPLYSISLRLCSLLSSVPSSEICKLPLRSRNLVVGILALSDTRANLVGTSWRSLLKRLNSFLDLQYGFFNGEERDCLFAFEHSLILLDSTICDCLLCWHSSKSGGRNEESKVLRFMLRSWWSIGVLSHCSKARRNIAQLESKQNGELFCCGLWNQVHSASKCQPMLVDSFCLWSDSLHSSGEISLPLREKKGGYFFQCTCA